MKTRSRMSIKLTHIATLYPKVIFWDFQLETLKDLVSTV
jgi:hypothetical protein